MIDPQDVRRIVFASLGGLPEKCQFGPDGEGSCDRSPMFVGLAVVQTHQGQDVMIYRAACERHSGALTQMFNDLTGGSFEASMSGPRH